MSIIITGLEMPTERESFNLTIKYNGTVLDTETGMQVAEAYELSPHSRLIEKDAILDKCYQHYEDFMLGKVDGKTALLNIEREIKSTPTIIETEKEEI